jgi:phosphoglycerate dehydrogenase-like enzyme
MRVAFLDQLEPRLAEFPARYLAGHEVLLTETAGQLPDRIEDAEAIVWWSYPVDSALIRRLPRLRFLQRIGLLRTSGDATAALDRGLPVSVLPHGVSDRVAQHALSLTLALVRKLPQSYRSLLAGENPDSLPEEQTAGPAPALNWTRTPDVDTLNDKVVGIAGFGEIGACLARLLRPFDCRVLYNKRNRLRPELEAHLRVEHATLDELLRRSDIVEACLPYTEATRKLIAGRELALMKPGALFINVGRGNTVDEPALVEALRSGAIAAAGLDVFAVEPLPATSPLRTLANVLLTPHSAGGTPGWINTFERIAANLERIEQGKPPILAMQAGDPQPG